MKEEVIKIIERVTDYSELENNIEIDLIENDILDSLGFIKLITELEETFDIEIQPSQVPGNIWKNVNDIVKMVEEKVEEQWKK